MNFDERLEFLKDLVISAGSIMLGAAEDRGVDFDSKEGTANFVTKYDVATQNYLIEGIKKAIPDAVFIAEEKENSSSVLSEEHCFIIDPIDGTSNFMNGLNHSAISLAYISRGKTLFGAIYDPYKKELFSAVAGGGAYLNGKPIHVSHREGERAIAVFGSTPYNKSEYGERTFALLKELFYNFGDVRRLGSAALDLAYLAAGRTDLFFELKLSVWDYAAGELILKEAGGIVTQIDGTPLSLEAPSSVFAANGLNHKKLLAIAEKYKT